jgi:fermentation-respiration switch protein FrsA (DUF1100 family)
MKNSFLTAAFAAAAALGCYAQDAAKPDVVGDWAGSLNTGAVALRLVLHITRAPAGLAATVDSPDQNARGIPVTSVTLDGSTLKFELAPLGASFEGKLNADATSVQGTFTQGGASFPLALSRAKDAAAVERKRPQNPVKPYPYREEDVSYENPAAGIKLAASFTIPQGKGPFPAVLLITGSGPQDRDESLMGHKPFLVLSDYLTRKGIAVLRADDRGVGKSGGVFAAATTADFATDAEAGVAWLKTRPEVDPRRIGLIGHSEGGIIAPMVAARNPAVAFIVMMAGSGVPGDQILPIQTMLIGEAAGVPHDVAVKNAELEREIVKIVEREKDHAAMEKAVRERLGSNLPEAQIRALESPWFRYFLEYDPAPALRKVKCPLLALNGEKDLQVPPKQNLPAIRKALEEGGNRHFETVEFPGLNHLFQTAKTGAATEYGDIEETIAPAVLEKIAGWILTQPGIAEP